MLSFLYMQQYVMHISFDNIPEVYLLYCKCTNFNCLTSKSSGNYAGYDYNTAPRKYVNLQPILL